MKRNKKLEIVTCKEFAYASGYAVCSGIAELCCLIALMTLPASVQYPVVTGGTILFSAMISAIAEKQRSLRNFCSAIIALIATILIIL